MGGVDKGREGKRLNKCWCNGLVTDYSTINRADAVMLLLAVAEKGGRDRQLVYEMLIDSRAIVLATERGSGFPRHPSLGDTSVTINRTASARGRCSIACIEQENTKI